MTGIKAAAIGGIGLATAQTLDIAQSDFERVGIISMCIMALIVVWRAGEKRQEKIEKLIEQISHIAEKSVTAIERNSEILAKLKDEFGADRE